MRTILGLSSVLVLMACAHVEGTRLRPAGAVSIAEVEAYVHAEWDRYRRRVALDTERPAENTRPVGVADLRCEVFQSQRYTVCGYDVTVQFPQGGPEVVRMVSTFMRDRSGKLAEVIVVA